MISMSKKLFLLQNCFGIFIKKWAFYIKFRINSLTHTLTVYSMVGGRTIQPNAGSAGRLHKSAEDGLEGTPEGPDSVPCSRHFLLISLPAFPVRLPTLPALLQATCNKSHGTSGIWLNCPPIFGRAKQYVRITMVKRTLLFTIYEWEPQLANSEFKEKTLESSELLPATIIW